MVASIVMCGIILLAAAIFLVFGATALLRQTPMHFWAGTTVKPEEIRDVAAYNKANAAL